MRHLGLRLGHFPWPRNNPLLSAYQYRCSNHQSETYQNFIASQQSNLFYLNGADYYDFMTEEVETYVPLLESAGLAKQ